MGLSLLHFSLKYVRLKILTGMKGEGEEHAHPIVKAMSKMDGVHILYLHQDGNGKKKTYIT